jgi:hypothetical protein
MLRRLLVCIDSDIGLRQDPQWDWTQIDDNSEDVQMCLQRRSQQHATIAVALGRALLRVCLKCR